MKIPILLPNFVGIIILCKCVQYQTGKSKTHVDLKLPFLGSTPRIRRGKERKKRHRLLLTTIAKQLPA